MKVQILPSLLAADYGCLAEEIRRVEAARADALHLDIMDAHFVPNLSFGPDMEEQTKKLQETSQGLINIWNWLMSRPNQLKYFGMVALFSIFIAMMSQNFVYIIN